jgi:hypothetical protein
MEKVELIRIGYPSEKLQAEVPVSGSDVCRRLFVPPLPGLQVDFDGFASWLWNKACGVHCGGLSGPDEEFALVRNHVAGKLEERIAV